MAGQDANGNYIPDDDSAQNQQAAATTQRPTRPGDYSYAGGIGGSGFLSGIFGNSVPSVNARLYQAGYTGPYTLHGQQPGTMTAEQGLGRVRQYGGANVDQSQQAQFRAAQMGLMGQLQTQAAGQGPSLATNMLREQTANNVQQQAGLAAALAAGGGSAGAARYGLGANTANMNQQAAGQAADARIQEQLAARQQLAALSGQARGQDIGLAETQAGLQNQAGIASMGQYNNQLGQDVTAANNAQLENQRLLQHQYEFGNTFQAQQQAADNAARLGLESGNFGAQQASQSAFGNAMGGLVDAGASFLGSGAVKFAKGGIVTHPTLALIGEAGPEAVVPLSGHGRLKAALHAHAMQNRANALAGAYGGR